MPSNRDTRTAFLLLNQPIYIENIPLVREREREREREMGMGDITFLHLYKLPYFFKISITHYLIPVIFLTFNLKPSKKVSQLYTFLFSKASLLIGAEILTPIQKEMRASSSSLNWSLMIDYLHACDA